MKANLSMKPKIPFILFDNSGGMKVRWINSLTGDKPLWGYSLGDAIRYYIDEVFVDPNPFELTPISMESAFNILAVYGQSHLCHRDPTFHWFQFRHVNLTYIFKIKPYSFD